MTPEEMKQALSNLMREGLVCVKLDWDEKGEPFEVYCLTEAGREFGMLERLLGRITG